MTPSPIDSSVMRACSLPRPSDALEALAVRDVASDGQTARARRRTRAVCCAARPTCPCSSLLMSCTSNGVSGSVASLPRSDVLAHHGAIRGPQQIGDRLADQRFRRRCRTARPPRDWRTGSCWCESTRPRAACLPTPRTTRCARWRRRRLGTCAANRVASSLRSSKRFIDAAMSTNALNLPLTAIRAAPSPEAKRLCRSSRSRSISRT